MQSIYFHVIPDTVDVNTHFVMCFGCNKFGDFPPVCVGDAAHGGKGTCLCIR